MVKSPRNQDDVDKLLKIMMTEGEASDGVKKEIGDLVKKYNEMLKNKGKPRGMKYGGKAKGMKNGGKTKVKGMKNGGKAKPKGMKNGGRAKPKGMRNGGRAKPKGMQKGGRVGGMKPVRIF